MTSEESTTVQQKIDPVLVCVFVIIVAGSALGNLSQTAVTPMLPDIQAHYGVDVGVSQLLSTVYTLVMGITMPIVTFLSRRFPMRVQLYIAWSLQIAGCLLNVVSASFALLVVGRVFQAMAAGVTLPLIQGCAMLYFPPNKQATAMGFAGLAMGLCPNIGPMFGGLFCEGPGWQFYFVMVACVTIVLAVCTVMLVPKGAAQDTTARLDFASFALSCLGFGGLLVGASSAANMSLGNPLVWAPILVGGVCVVAFIVRQKRIASPLIHLEIFQYPRFRGAFIASSFLYASFIGIALILPVYLQQLCGQSAVVAGLVFLPIAVVAAVANPLSGVLTDKIGHRPVIVFSCIFLVVGSVCQVFMTETTPIWLVIAFQVIRSTGVSSQINPISAWALSDLPPEILMDGSSFMATTRQVFAAVGTAIMVFMLTTFAPVFPTVPAMPYHFAFGFSAACAVICTVLTLRAVK